MNFDLYAKLYLNSIEMSEYFMSTIKWKLKKKLIWLVTFFWVKTINLVDKTLFRCIKSKNYLIIWKNLKTFFQNKKKIGGLT